MGFLKRALERTIGEAVGKAVGKAIEPAVSDLTKQATDIMDQAEVRMEQESRKSESSFLKASGLESTLAGLENSVMTRATEAAKNMKVCPNCNTTTSADKKFCPECGTQLPEQTIAEGSICPSCGKQNSVGTKFCQDCGTKLPAAIALEEAQKNKDQEVLNEWAQWMPQVPVWNCGGSQYNLDEYERNSYGFSAGYDGSHRDARRAVEAYRDYLKTNGFREAGQYPNEQHLYKRVDGVVYHVDTEHCFEGDSDRACIYFNQSEPTGGFDYVKPEPKKKFGFSDLFR